MVTLTPAEAMTLPAEPVFRGVGTHRDGNGRGDRWCPRCARRFRYAPPERCPVCKTRTVTTCPA